MIKGMLCWTVAREDEMEPCVPKPLKETEYGGSEDEQFSQNALQAPKMMFLYGGVCEGHYVTSPIEG